MTSTGQRSRVRKAKKGNLQGSVFSLMLFDIYIHDLVPTKPKEYSWWPGYDLMTWPPTKQTVLDGSGGGHLWNHEHLYQDSWYDSAPVRCCSPYIDKLGPVLNMSFTWYQPMLALAKIRKDGAMLTHVLKAHVWHANPTQMYHFTI